MTTEEKLNTLIELVDSSITVMLGHITQLNQVDQLMSLGKDLQEKLRRLKQL